MYDPLLSLLAMREAADMPMEYLGMNVKLYKLLMSTFPLEEVLKAEKDRSLWHPIFNYNVDKLDHRDLDGGLGSNSSTNKLLFDYLEKEENVTYSRVRAAMDVWLGLLVVAFELKKKYSGQLCLRKIGALCLLTSRKFPTHTGHKYFEHTKQGNLVLSSWYQVQRTRHYGFVLEARSFSTALKGEENADMYIKDCVS